MKNPELILGDGKPESLADLYHGDNCNIFAIMDAVEDSTTGAELVKNLNALKLFSKFTLERETDEYVRLVTVDCFAKKHYLKADKAA